MEEYRPLAPVHTDVYLTAIKAFQNLVSSVPLVGLFETHFHVNIPEEARRFASGMGQQAMAMQYAKETAEVLPGDGGAARAGVSRVYDRKGWPGRTKGGLP